MTEAYDIRDILADDETDKRPWAITDDRAADWAMRKIKELDADTASWANHYARLTEQVTRQNDAAKERLMEHLARYFEAVPHHKTKTQESYALPTGKIGVKTVTPGYVRDDAALLPWVKENRADLVEVKESVKWSELKKLLDTSGGTAVDRETGEVVPGVTVTPGGMKFFVQMAKEAEAHE